MNVNEYALKILEDHGCDCYTYGGEWSEHVLSDLKEAYPDGMEFPYVDVANAILAISRPEPIKRSHYKVIFDTDSFCDGCDASSFDEAKDIAEGILVDWAVDEQQQLGCPLDVKEWTEKQIDEWDYMIYNSSVWVEKYNPDTDEYEECWGLSYEDEKKIGWLEYSELIKEYGKETN